MWCNMVGIERDSEHTLRQYWKKGRSRERHRPPDLFRGVFETPECECELDTSNTKPSVKAL